MSVLVDSDENIILYTKMQSSIQSFRQTLVHLVSPGLLQRQGLSHLIYTLCKCVDCVKGVASKLLCKYERICISFHFSGQYIICDQDLLLMLKYFKQPYNGAPGGSIYKQES